MYCDKETFYTCFREEREIYEVGTVELPKIELVEPKKGNILVYKKYFLRAQKVIICLVVGGKNIFRRLGGQEAGE